MKLKNDPNKLEVYTESRKRRLLVGELSYSTEDKKYRFKYNQKYKTSKSAIPIGPDLDLFRKEHVSKEKKLFSSFVDRIPSKSNPAYEEYCNAMGISPTEKNQILLLTTIGKKGPSTFIFEAVPLTDFSSFEVLSFRKKLQLSRHDFATLFGLNELTVQRIEKNETRDSAAFQLVKILLTFPEVALWRIMQTGKNVSGEVADRVKDFLELQIKYKKNEESR
jgi:HipA-like protein